MNEIIDIIHNTIYQFFDVCGDDEEVPISDKDKLLLEVNKAICNNVRALEQEPKADVLDKIRAEIQKEENIWYHDCEPDFSKVFDVIRVDTVLSIIDKYRESEEA